MSDDAGNLPRIEDRLGVETFHWFVVHRKNGYHPINVRGQFVQAEKDGTISVIDLPSAKVVNTFKAGTGIETLAYY